MFLTTVYTFHPPKGLRGINLAFTPLYIRSVVEVYSGLGGSSFALYPRVVAAQYAVQTRVSFRVFREVKRQHAINLFDLFIERPLG